MSANALLDQVSTPAVDNLTYFSSFPFIAAVASTLGPGHRPYALPVRDSGRPRHIYALDHRERFGSRYLSLAPYWLWASPGWDGDLSAAAVNGILACLKTPLTRGFTWDVRFDHSALAKRLLMAGLFLKRTSTHVLRLDCDYGSAFQKYNMSTRQNVRKSLRAGVRVREAWTRTDIDEYYRVHSKLADSKEFQVRYPVGLLYKLVEDRSSVRLLVAEYGGCLIAGGVFLRDGCSVLYWHSAGDRTYSKFFPTYAVLDSAIQWACQIGAEFFNFGGSAGIASLEAFKSNWGATVEWNWSFEWRNPIWSGLSRVKTILVR